MALTRPAVALHLYLGALDSAERTMFHPDTGRAMPFDLNVYYGLCRHAVVIPGC